MRSTCFRKFGKDKYKKNYSTHKILCVEKKFSKTFLKIPNGRKRTYTCL